MKKYWLQYTIIAIGLLSCKKIISIKDGLVQNTTSYDYELVAGAKILSYELDNNTYYRFPALYTYTDISGKEYLVFKNFGMPYELNFYDLNKQILLFKTPIEREGPNAIPGPASFFIEDFNNIFITCSMTPFLYKIDTTGNLIQKIRYGITDSGYAIIPQNAFSSDYRPLIFIDSKLYLTQKPWQGNPISKTPLCAVVDTVNQTQYELPMLFPPFYKDNELYSIMSGTDDFSRIFNGKEFVYSFFVDENIHVVDVEHTSVLKYQIKSQYINKIIIERKLEGSDQEVKRYFERAYYGNLIYDRYRNIYYRFTYPDVELEVESNFYAIATNGRKKFSIIILDNNFNIIGETLLPEWTYWPTVMFVHRDGLYICNNHPKNPSFNENILSFQCFEVRKKQ